MLTCSACVKHCLRSIIEGPPLVCRSSYSASTVNRRQAHTSSRAVKRRSFYLRNASQEPDRDEAKDGIPPIPSGREGWPKSGDETSLSSPTKDRKLDQAVAKHLTFLKDPLKLADFVRQKLRDDDFETAVTIVRAASKNTQCIVSWNHLIDWQISRGLVNAALKTYNEMKKRAQFPDAYTYTIIFNGYSETKVSVKASLPKVMSIYHSMLSEKSAVKPNTIHMNAVLKMCARAGNIDAMLAIADDMPVKGIRAANNLTFTTIINGLQSITASDLRADYLTSMQKRQAIQKAILEARHIWEDVIKRWRQGDIWIDEELVASMGRILLLGEVQDWDDTMSLIEQTMNIPRPVPRLGTNARNRIEPSAQGRTKSSEEQRKEKLSSDEPSDDAEPANPLANFRPVALPKAPDAKDSKVGMYAKPGQNSLSLILDALLKLHMKEPANKYWNVFTGRYNVSPDSNNFHCYLRVLRAARASTETVSLLTIMPESYMEGKTFRIAMSTCLRDKLNRSSFKNANKILDLMQNSLETPDIKAFQTYLELAATASASPEQASSSPQSSDLARISQGKQILYALDRLNPSILNIKSVLFSPDTSLSKIHPRDRKEYTDGVANLAKSMISALDKMMSRAMVPQEEYASLQKQRSKLAALVDRFGIAKRVEQALPETASSSKSKDPAVQEQVLKRLSSGTFRRQFRAAEKSTGTKAAVLNDIRNEIP